MTAHKRSVTIRPVFKNTTRKGLICIKKALILALVLALTAFSCASLAEETAPACIGEHKTIEVNGVSLYYEVAGVGKPVVLVHGNGGSHEALHTETEALVAAGYQVFAGDSRGQGANERLTE